MNALRTHRNDAWIKRVSAGRYRGVHGELTNFASMIGGSGALVAVGATLVGHMTQIMRTSLSIEPERLAKSDSMTSALGEAISNGLVGLLPIFGVLVGLVLLASIALGGWNFSATAMTPDFTRMSPLSGIKRVFGVHGVTELGKAPAQMPRGRWRLRRHRFVVVSAGYGAWAHGAARGPSIAAPAC